MSATPCQRAPIVPTPTTADDASPLSAEHVAAWREQGAVVVDRLVPIDLVGEA